MFWRETVLLYTSGSRSSYLSQTSFPSLQHCNCNCLLSELFSNKSTGNDLSIKFKLPAVRLACSSLTSHSNCCIPLQSTSSHSNPSCTGREATIHWSVTTAGLSIRINRSLIPTNANEEAAMPWRIRHDLKRVLEKLPGNGRALIFVLVCHCTSFCICLFKHARTEA